jgi:hypothetical protein
VTYRIAQVRFRKSDDYTYPVNCDRADIEPGDKVIVKTPNRDKKFQTALVDSVEFLNWNCKNSIVCLYSEVERRPDGSWSANQEFLCNGQIHTIRQLQDRLRASGWKSRFPRGSTYQVIFELQVRGEAAEIRFRKNGIDLRTSSRSVNHWYFESEIDLLEFCWSFAQCWQTGVDGYDKFFEAKGRSFPKSMRSSAGLSGLYEALSGGSGGSAYLGDGIWIGPGGHTWEEHR